MSMARLSPHASVSAGRVTRNTRRWQSNIGATLKRSPVRLQLKDVCHYEMSPRLRPRLALVRLKFSEARPNFTVKLAAPGFGPGLKAPRTIIIRRAARRPTSSRAAMRGAVVAGAAPRGFVARARALQLTVRPLAAPESTYGEKRRRENRSATCTLTVIARPQRYRQHWLRRASRGVAACTSEVLSGSAVAERHAPSSTVP